MKRFNTYIAVCLFALTALFCLSCSSIDVNRGRPYLSFKTDIERGDVILSGSAHNLSCDKTAGVRIRLFMEDDSLKADGSYDNRTLFGRFESESVYVTRDDAGVYSIQFEGVMFLGDDGSELNSGTEIPYNMTILFNRNGISGIYRIDPIDDGIEWEQYGTLDLRFDSYGDAKETALPRHRD